VCPPAQVQDSGARTQDQAWWQNDVIYEIYTRSFADSHDDGVGDLKDLGDAIWIPTLQGERSWWC